MLRVSVTPGERAVLRIEGRVVCDVLHELREACLRELSDRGPMIVDLSGVTFVDEPGAAALREVASRGGTLVGASRFLTAYLEDNGGRDGD